MKVQLQVGKTYSTANGCEVTIIEENTNRFYPFKGDNELEYAKFGTYFQVEGSYLDLVKEVCIEPKSITIPDSVIEKLKSLAQQETWNDIINDTSVDKHLWDLTDGNEDDTYEAGENSGQVDLAREILQELGISWDK